MEAQPFWHLSSTLTWIFVFWFPPTCSGMDAPNLDLDSSVFVAFADKGLNIDCALTIPANYSKDFLKCFDPSHREIYEWDAPSTGGQPDVRRLSLELKNLTSSGEYYCQYKTVKVYWFLRLRHHGYTDVGVLDYMFITGCVLTSVLLVFSVIGSVYVFRGYQKESKRDPGNSGRKRKNNRQERMESEAKEDNTNAIASTSTSFYASLETRPRSIYDVLDRTAVRTESDQSQAKRKKKEPQETVAQTSEPQQEEGVFESVYENF